MRRKRKITDREHRIIMRLGGYDSGKRTLLELTTRWYRWCGKYKFDRQRVHTYNLIKCNTLGEQLRRKYNRYSKFI